MSQEQTPLTILFADISGSIQMYERLGDTEARRVIARCIELMFGKTQEFHGTVIKTIGDEVLCTFNSADDGVGAATAMQKGITQDLQSQSDNIVLSIRVGLHYGPVIREQNDVFGDTVNLAARMADRAKAGQIITTADTVAALSRIWQRATRHVDTVPVKGKSGEIQIHEVIWQPEGSTWLTPEFVRRSPQSRAVLTLSFGGHSVDVAQDSGEVIIGRDSSAHLTVNAGKASRLHLYIECLRGKFILTDRSTNGTYVRTTTGEIYLRSGESIMLTDSGGISLGQPFEESPEVVSFNTRTG